MEWDMDKELASFRMEPSTLEIGGTTKCKEKEQSAYLLDSIQDSGWMTRWMEKEKWLDKREES